MPDTTPPSGIRRFLHYAVPATAVLVLLNLGVWAYARWEHLLPSWSALNPVTAYTAWKNRPKPAQATLTVTGPGTGEWRIAGQTLPIRLCDETTHKAICEWTDSHHILVTRLDLNTPDTASWLETLSLLFSTPDCIPGGAIFVTTHPSGLGPLSQTATFTPVACPHCSVNGRILVELELSSEKPYGCNLFTAIGKEYGHAESTFADLSDNLYALATQARTAGVISQPDAITLRCIVPETLTVNEAVELLSACNHCREIKDITFEFAPAADPEDLTAPAKRLSREERFEQRLRALTHTHTAVGFRPMPMPPPAVR